MRGIIRSAQQYQSASWVVIFREEWEYAKRGGGGDPRSGWGRRTSVKYTCIKRNRHTELPDLSMTTSPFIILPAISFMNDCVFFLAEERSKVRCISCDSAHCLRTRRSWAKTKARQIFIFMKLDSGLFWYREGTLEHHEKLHFVSFHKVIV
jgi:hypothetical protein